MSIIRDFNQFKVYVFQPNVPLGDSYTAHIAKYMRQYNINDDLTCFYMFGNKDNTTFLMYKRIETFIVSRREGLFVKEYKDWSYHNFNRSGPINDVIVKYLVIVEFPKEIKEFQAGGVTIVDNNFAISYLLDQSTNIVQYDNYGKKEGRMNINFEINNLTNILGSNRIYPLVDIIYVYTKNYSNNRNIVITNDLLNDRYVLPYDMVKYSHRIYLIFGIKH